MTALSPVTLIGVSGAALSVPLLEPFVIATGTMTSTRSVVVRVTARAGSETAVGLGEAAALPPVTACDQPELVTDLDASRGALEGTTAASIDELAERLAERVANPVLRAGIEAAVLDAWGKLVRRPVCDLLARTPTATSELVTDITIPIASPEHMAELARHHLARGFSTFKIKVGRDLDADVAALRAIAAAGQGRELRLRLDANGGYDLRAARALLAAARDLPIECFEQPCARGDEAAMAELARETDIPLVADESLRSADDLDRIARLGAASAVNLKLVKLGGLVAAHAIGRRAREAGLDLMCGAMVETRLGLTAMMHVTAALGGARFVDLDTQLLLAEEWCEGGYNQEGPRMRLGRAPGLGVTEIE